VIGRGQSRGVHVTSTSVAREHFFPVDIMFRLHVTGVTRLILERNSVIQVSDELTFSYEHFVVNFMPPLSHIKQDIL